jgi:hypothetical protein
LACRFYEWVQKRLGPSRALFRLGLADKKSCLPIAAADLLAYSAWGQEVGQKPIGILKTRSKSDASSRTNIAKVDLNRDSLKSLHEQAIGTYLDSLLTKRALWSEGRRSLGGPLFHDGFIGSRHIALSA